MNTFQDQELVTDLDVNWVSFKWRNHDPAIGRFFNVDPLAESYVHNSPYAFSENKVVSHIELEGLEAVMAPRPGMRRAPSARNNRRRTAREAAKIPRRSSGIASIGGVRNGATSTRRTKYSTSRGNGSSGFGTSRGVTAGFGNHEHSFGNTAGNGAKVLIRILKEAQTLIDNSESVTQVESFTEAGAFELSLGSDYSLDGVEATTKLQGLQGEWQSEVMNSARGDMSAEEFGKLDGNEQSIRIQGAEIAAGPSPLSLLLQRIQDSDDSETTREEETTVRSGN
jgi:hypothetical protein